MKRYAGCSNWDLSTTFVAIDRQGNAYITGGSPGQSHDTDIVTVKYGPTGNEVWTKRYTGPVDGSSPTGLMADRNGNVQVTGRSQGDDGTGYDYVTLMYAGLPATTTTLTSSVNPSTPGQWVDFTARVAGSSTATSASNTASAASTIPTNGHSKFLRRRDPAPGRRTPPFRRSPVWHRRSYCRKSHDNCCLQRG